MPRVLRAPHWPGYLDGNSSSKVQYNPDLAKGNASHRSELGLDPHTDVRASPPEQGARYRHIRVGGWRCGEGWGSQTGIQYCK